MYKRKNRRKESIIVKKKKIILLTMGITNMVEVQSFILKRKKEPHRT
jgi:hypothetical protein